MNFQNISNTSSERAVLDIQPVLTLQEGIGYLAQMSCSNTSSFDIMMEASVCLQVASPFPFLCQAVPLNISSMMCADAPVSPSSSNSTETKNEPSLFESVRFFGVHGASPSHPSTPTRMLLMADINLFLPTFNFTVAQLESTGEYTPIDDTYDLSILFAENGNPAQTTNYHVLVQISTPLNTFTEWTPRSDRMLVLELFVDDAAYSDTKGVFASVQSNAWRADYALTTSAWSTEPVDLGTMVLVAVSPSLPLFIPALATTLAPTPGPTSSPTVNGPYEFKDVGVLIPTLSIKEVSYTEATKTFFFRGRLSTSTFKGCVCVCVVVLCLFFKLSISSYSNVFSFVSTPFTH